MPALLSCAQKNTASSAIPLPEKTTPAEMKQLRFFTEGCFWHTEIFFQSLTGVRDAISDYAAGKTKNPDYKSIGSGQTGHAETVQVFTVWLRSFTKRSWLLFLPATI
jgi:peptide-methionine (S)-S-oxide reductase